MFEFAHHHDLPRVEKEACPANRPTPRRGDKQAGEDKAVNDKRGTHQVRLRDGFENGGEEKNRRGAQYVDDDERGEETSVADNVVVQANVIVDDHPENDGRKNAHRKPVAEELRGKAAVEEKRRSQNGKH